MNPIAVTDPGLVVLIGASSAGKTTFAQRHFRPTEVVSSDACRALIIDDENDQTVSVDAFDLLHLILRKRLVHGRLAVVDATSLHRTNRASLIRVARETSTSACAIYLRTPDAVCKQRARGRVDRDISVRTVAHQLQVLRATIKTTTSLTAEGFDRAYILRSVEEVDQASIVREPPRPRKVPDRTLIPPEDPDFGKGGVGAAT